MAYSMLKGKKIYYEVHGEGQPLVILNGIMMSTVSWKLFLPSLSAYQVILIDFFDQGLSDNMDEAYSHESQVEVVLQVIKELCLDRVYMTGISYGAQVALQFALNYGHRLKKLVVFNGAAYTTPWLKDIGIAWQKAARTYDPDLFYHVAIPYIYSPGFYNTNNQWMQERKALLMKVFTRVFLNRLDRLIASSESYDIRNKIKLIDVPVLVVGTALDYITPIDEAEFIYDQLREGTFLVIDGCGHASMYEKPVEFISIIKGFLTQGPTIKVIG